MSQIQPTRGQYPDTEAAIRRAVQVGIGEGVDVYTFGVMAKRVAQDVSEERARAIASDLYGGSAFHREPHPSS